MLNTRIAYYLFFSLMIAISCVFLYQFTEKSSPTTKIESSLLPDYIIEPVVTFRFNPQGQLLDYFLAKKMIHFTENDTGYFTEPVLYIYQNQQQTWHIKSKAGRSIQNFTTLFLQGDVWINQAKNNAVLTTNTLTLYPDKNQAETDDAVFVRQPGIQMRGVGMRADLTKQTVQLLSNAKGFYGKQNK